MTILVTGGAGYIGSHMCWLLADAEVDFVVIDDLSTGVRANVPGVAKFYEGDVGDEALLDEVMTTHDIDAVVHFAGSIIVPESVENPLKYYENNTAKSRNLIAACVRNGVQRFIFSSTAAVYGIPENNPTNEDTPPNCLSPYATSKLMTEFMLRDTAAAHDFSYVALRYFNVGGADPELRTGQSAPNATHLLKLAYQTVLGEREKLFVTGDDYPTRDGTGVRDYIHVSDLVDAHGSAIRYLQEGGESVVLNLGYGHGFSVLEVIEAVERVIGRPLPNERAPRRPGDPPEIVADSSKLRDLFGWEPKHDDLEKIIRTALAWEEKLLGRKAS